MNNQLMTISEVQVTAENFFNSKLFTDVKDISVAIVKIQAGQEIGLKPFQSMSGFDIIQGKMVLKPYAMAGIVKQSGKYEFTVKLHNDDICILTWYNVQSGLELGESSFSIQDAENAGLLNKQVWKQYRKDMLFNRALSRGCRWYAMDTFMQPVYVEHELEQTNTKEIQQDNTVQELKDINDKIQNFSSKEELENYKSSLTNLKNGFKLQVENKIRQKAIELDVINYSKEIQKLKSVNDFNDFTLVFANLDGELKLPVWNVLKEQALQKNIHFNSNTKLFEHTENIFGE